MGAYIDGISPKINVIQAISLSLFDSLLNNRALCFSTSVNSVCSSDPENFGLLVLLILVQKYRIYYTKQLRTK